MNYIKFKEKIKIFVKIFLQLNLMCFFIGIFGVIMAEYFDDFEFQKQILLYCIGSGVGAGLFWGTYFAWTS